MEEKDHIHSTLLSMLSLLQWQQPLQPVFFSSLIFFSHSHIMLSKYYIYLSATMVSSSITFVNIDGIRKP
jgi:hypothetical protein